MIIKSMTRKKATFSQLVDYVEEERADDRFNLYHNIYGRNGEQVKAEFVRNAQRMRERKNGISMYHEILSIKKSSKISLDKQKEILRTITVNYIRARANNNLVYCVMHDDKQDQLHYHIIISSNEYGSDRKTRLSKGEFDHIKKSLEQMVLQTYPELEQQTVMNKRATEKLSREGGELKRRTGKTPERDNTKERIETAFNQARDKKDLLDRLEKAQLKIYQRGQTVGVLDEKTGRKHRLKTIGLQESYEALQQRLDSHVVDRVQTQAGKRTETAEQSHGLQPGHIDQVKAELEREQALQEARERAELERVRAEAQHRRKTAQEEEEEEKAQNERNRQAYETHLAKAKAELEQEQRRAEVTRSAEQMKPVNQAEAQHNIEQTPQPGLFRESVESLNSMLKGENPEIGEQRAMNQAREEEEQQRRLKEAQAMREGQTQSRSTELKR